MYVRTKFSTSGYFIKCTHLGPNSDAELFSNINTKFRQDICMLGPFFLIAEYAERTFLSR
jgi:hypothetical protein